MRWLDRLLQRWRIEKAVAHVRAGDRLLGIAGSGLEVIFEADMKWLEPEARREMEYIAVKDGKTVEVPGWVTVHGPLFASDGGQQFALRWAAAEPAATSRIAPQYVR